MSSYFLIITETLNLLLITVIAEQVFINDSPLMCWTLPNFTEWSFLPSCVSKCVLTYLVRRNINYPIQQNTCIFQCAAPIQPFVWPSCCVYGCWCEPLRQTLGTIHQQNGLVSLYIHTNHNCLNDTSCSMVHMKCVTQTHQHTTRTLLCRPFDSCLTVTQKWKPDSTH